MTQKMKKGSDELRLEVFKTKNNAVASIRQFYKDAKSGEFKPGKQGLTLTVDEIPIFVKNLKVIYQELKEQEEQE